MKSTKGRTCDICGSDIPQGEKYRRVTMEPEAAAILLEARDADLVPDMSQDKDGKVNIDICLECHMNMGPAVKENEKKNH